MDNLPTQPNQTPKSLYNPLATDFTVQMRDDDNMQIPYTIPAGEMKTFPAYIADYIERHLLDALYHLEGNPKNDRDIEKAKLLERIRVTI